jgi:site-specific DNA recombinase
MTMFEPQSPQLKSPLNRWQADYRGLCANRVLIRQDRMEEQLINGLTQKVLQPEMIDYLFERFVGQLQKRLDSLRQASSNATAELNALQMQRSD